MWNFPYSIGVLDGKYFRIRCRSLSGWLFLNSKVFLRICFVVYCVCASRKKLCNCLSSFFSFFPSRHFFWTDCQKHFSERFIICDQDLTHSIDTLKLRSVRIFPEVVIRDPCDTWHGLCTVTSIHSIQKSTRNSQKLGNKLVRPVSQWMTEDSTVKTERNRVDK